MEQVDIETYRDEDTKIIIKVFFCTVLKKF